MGFGYTIRCKSCTYCFGAMLGTGMLYSSAMAYRECDEDGQPIICVSVKDKSIRKKVSDILDDNTCTEEYYEDLYICPKCMRFANGFYFKLNTSSGEYIPEYRCEECETVLKRIKEVNSEKDNDGDRHLSFKYRNGRKVRWKCPECGCDKMTTDTMIMWD